MSKQRGLSILALLGGLLVLIACSAWMWDFVVIGNTRIGFYGRVVDPNGRGIPNMMIDVQIQKGKMSSPRLPLMYSGGDLDILSGWVVSDQNGDFEFHSRGEVIVVSMPQDSAYQIIDPANPSSAINLPTTTFEYSFGGGLTGPLPSTPAKRIVYTLAQKYGTQ